MSPIPTSSSAIDDIWADAKKDLTEMMYGELVLVFKIHQGKATVEKRITRPMRYELRILDGDVGD